MPGIQTYLGVAAGDVPLLRAWYGTAIDWCHEKLSRRDFVAADGFTGDQPPDACVLGVYEFAKVLYHYHQRNNVNARKIKTGAREEEYEPAGTAGRISAAALAAWPYIEPYVEDPTLFASGGA